MIIGVVGGMGSYATLNFFERYLNVFEAEKEWDRPRIIIDNRCTMPSRVRAILYNENWDDVVDELTDSISRLADSGCNRIILACNTSHVFLNDVFSRKPELKPLVVNIIERCALDIKSRNIGDVSLIATEGTILSNIYQSVFERYQVKVNAPSEDVFSKLRYFIEIVKQNKYTQQTFVEFKDFIEEQPSEVLVLGCTEFPVIYSKMKNIMINTSKQIFDPLESTLFYLHSEFIANK